MLLQELLKIAEHRARLLERVALALALAENKRLRESVEALKKSLAEAHGNKEKLQ